MLRTLDKEVFKAFKVPPEWFIEFLLKLHDRHPNESGFMNRIEFLQENLDETIQGCDRTGR